LPLRKIKILPVESWHALIKNREFEKAAVLKPNDPSLSFANGYVTNAKRSVEMILEDLIYLDTKL